MSSDSEDDCYGNIAQRLQMMKNQYKDDLIPIKNLMDTSQDTPKNTDNTHKITETSAEVTCVELKDDSDCDEISLDTIIAQNTKKKPVRRSKRNADISIDNIIQTTGRKRTRNSSKVNNTVVSVDLDVTAEKPSFIPITNDISISGNTTRNKTSRGRNRGRGRGRCRKGANNSANSSNISTSNTASTIHTNNSTNSVSNNTSMVNEVLLNTVLRPTSYGRQGRQSARHRQRQENLLDHLLSAMYGMTDNTHPTYSVGNTDDYEDESYNQPLFSSNTSQHKKDKVVVTETVEDLNESLDDNEELSVKVYWQNRECVKFTIRRFQKLQTIYDFFANREKVDIDRLFFTYNDKILKKDDTPDSITYSEVKFIDGGIINQRLNILQDENQELVKNGIKLKFQCQNVKKPFEVYIKPEDKLAVAMTQCAEHLEKPLGKLKFLFDGDLITGKDTPTELELEGGECIDVKIIS